MTRHEAREQAFTVLFEELFQPADSLEELATRAEDSGFIKLNGFSRELLSLVDTNRAEIDALIDEHCRDWSRDRLPRVSLAVLRLAIAEIRYGDEIPAGVAVNEAVELAKPFGTPEDASYINGVLGTIVRGA